MLPATVIKLAKLTLPFPFDFFTLYTAEAERKAEEEHSRAGEERAVIEEKRQADMAFFINEQLKKQDELRKDQEELVATKKAEAERMGTCYHHQIQKSHN